MTTEEIEKAAEEYANKHFSSKDIEMYQLSGKQVSRIIKTTFASGVEFSDKHWQEKSRWKSLETEPPKLPSNPSEEKQVLIKHAKGGYDVKFLVKQSSIDYWLKEGFVIWKEIK